MKRYRHLSIEERYHIYTMKKQGYSHREIASGMGRHNATISREIFRNTGLSGYRYKQANCKAQIRHKTKPKLIKMAGDLLYRVKQGILSDWSPEQISGRMKLDCSFSVCHETIYRYLIVDKQAGGTLYTHLRHKAKPYRKRYGKNDYRGTIPGRVDIDERPSIVDNRDRIGDWEADTVIGKGHKGAIVTLAERKSRLFLAMPISHKRSGLTTDAIIKMLAPFVKYTATITFDNGREFCGHNNIAKTLDCGTYFAKPYHSWERGLNENSNGLLRQYLPKDMSFDKLTQEEVYRVTSCLNERPRKCLGYKTPWESFREFTDDNHFNQSVALVG